MAKLQKRPLRAPVKGYDGGGDPPHAGTSPPPRNGDSGPNGQDAAHLSPREIQAMDLEPNEVVEEEQLEEEVPKQIAIGKRIGDWRTLLSFGIAAAILVFAVGKAG